MSNFMSTVDRENFGQDRSMNLRTPFELPANLRTPVEMSMREVEKLLPAIAAEYGVEHLSILFPEKGEFKTFIRDMAMRAWDMERTNGYLDLIALADTMRIIVETKIKAYNLLGGA